MMVETMLDCSQDFGGHGQCVSNGGVLPQWKRELLARRAGRGRGAAAGPCPSPSPRPAAPRDWGAEEEQEELRYGPGIVNRLRSRYLSLALRDQPPRASVLLRRAASLEHMLDGPCPPPPPPPAPAPAPALPQPQPRRPQPAPAPPPPRRDAVKRARSVDALSRLEPHAPPPAPPAPRAPRPPRRAAPLLRDAERPPPDVVRSTLRKFESGAGGARAGGTGTARYRRGAPPLPPLAAANPVLLRRVGVIRPMPPAPPPPPPPPPHPGDAADPLETPIELELLTQKDPSLKPSVLVKPEASITSELLLKSELILKSEQPLESEDSLKSELFLNSEAPLKSENSFQSELPIQSETHSKTDPPPKSEPPTNSELILKSESPMKSKSPFNSEFPMKPEVPLKPEPLVKSEVPFKPEVPLKSEPPVKAEVPLKSEPPVKTEVPLKCDLVRCDSPANSPRRRPLPAGAPPVLPLPSVPLPSVPLPSVPLPSVPLPVPGAVSVVFNFSSRPSVPDYIENDGLVLRAARRHRLKNCSGSGLAAAPSGDDGDETDSADADADAEPAAAAALSPPVRFLNAGVLINGRSSLLSPHTAALHKTRMHKLKLQFDDSLTRTHEYPSETSFGEDAPAAPTAPAAPPPAHLPLAANTHIVSAALSRYTPAKTAADGFVLGVTPPPGATPPSGPPTDPRDSQDGLESIDCVEESYACAWSRARRADTDLLF